MATTGDARDRLQPALLDRLTDHAPTSASETEDRRVMSRAALRSAVLRDLGWLFNAVQPMQSVQSAQYPQSARSVLNFGLPPLSGQVASRVDISQVEKAIHRAILDFEPRIVSESISVKAIEADDVLGTHNVIEFEIRGLLWAQPVPLELLLRTQLDLEAGQVEVKDMATGAVAGWPAGGAS